MASKTVRFEYYETRKNISMVASETEWRWRLVAANGENIANGSEGYATKRNVLRAIDKVEELLAFSYTGEASIPVIQVLQ